MISNLIFDFDGVILDTESTEFQSWQEIYQEYGVELKKDIWIDCIGRPHGYFDAIAHLESLSHQHIDRNQLRARRRNRVKDLNNLLPVLPGIKDLIIEAQNSGFGLGVVSSSDRPWVQGHLERVGLLSDFQKIICAEDTSKHKPDPEPYLSAIEKLACRPEEAVAFEDSPPGIHSAKAAGISCVAIPSPMTLHMSFDGADLCLDSLGDVNLKSLIQRLSGKP